jgi:anti-anti-sigma factor
MKPENLAGVLGSRIPPPPVVGPKRLKLNLEAQPGGAVVVHCEGRIVYGPEVRSLTDIVANMLPSARRMVVDLAGVEIVDSACLGELVLMHMWAEAAGYALKFASPRNSVRQLLELTNLSAVFDTHGSVAEALAAMYQEQVCSA